MKLRRKPSEPPERPQEPLSAPESAEEAIRPLFPKQRQREAPSGLIVSYEQLPPTMRRQRRADNKRMREIHSKVRRRKKHGRQ
jgi:hypothetical protein